ncbi:MAG TPA: hypothetical protein VM942_00220 [Acidimicrobiales bacterium]|nr:hypothetical protein [Acidimicrobiales bacterium]
MLLAELEVRHSRAVAPTRRVALGQLWLPTDPAPGYGGVLLGGIVAAHLGELDPESRLDFLALVDDVAGGQTIVQPRLRHRFQTDIVGLDRTLHKLTGTVEQPSEFDIGGFGRSIPQLLGAVYAAGRTHAAARPAVFTAIRKGAQWQGGLGRELIDHLSDLSSFPPVTWRRFATDERWAREILGFGPESEPDRDEVVARFRSLLRESHPDHGGESEGAGQRILELTEARRILLP